MQWPEVGAVEQRSKQDQSARHAAQVLGTGNVDEMVMAAMRRHQAKIEGRAREEAAAAESEDVPE